MLFIWPPPLYYFHLVFEFSSVIKSIITQHYNQMSSELTSKIQLLTTKLQNAHLHSPKSSAIQDVRQKLINLRQYIAKQLAQTTKRVSQIQDKFQRRLSSAQRQQKSIALIWNERQQRVTEVIGKWVQEYEWKAQQTIDDLQRQEQLIHMRLQEQQQSINKQANQIQSIILEQLRTLQSQIHKYKAMRQQQQSILIAQIQSSKQHLIELNAQNRQLAIQKISHTQKNIKELGETVKAKYDYFMSQIKTRSSKMKQIFQLLMQSQ